MTETIRKVTKFSARLVPKQSWQALIILWVIFALNANAREILNRLIPYITNDYHLTGTTAGLIGMVGYLGMTIASIPFSRWADTRGNAWKRRNVILIFAIGYMTCTALCGINAITVTFGVMLVLQFLRGLFAGGGDPCEVGTVAEWWPREKTGLALGIHHSSYPWGAFLGGLIITGALLVVGDANWRMMFFIFPVIGIVIYTIFYKWSTPKRYAEFEANIKKVGMTPPLELDGKEGNYVPPKGVLTRCLKNPNIVVTAIASIFCHFAYIGFNFWMPLYLAFVAGYSFAAAASLSIVFTITGGLGQIICGHLADRFGTKRILLICSLWLAVAFWLMQYISISIGVLIGLQLFLGCCANAVYPVMYSFCAHSAEPGAVVTSNGILNTGLYLGACVSTVIMGWLIELGGGLNSINGYLTGVYLMSGSMFIVFLMILIFTRETNGSRFGKDFSLVSLKSCNLEEDTKK